MSKKREVVTAIKDLSASLFYKKVRGDDEEVPENRTPENRTPEIRTPENRTPEIRTPENRTPENRTPENRTPENRTPEIRTPEIRTPEIRTPENRCPENRAFSNQPSYGKLIEVAKEINFTALGVLAVLIEAFPTGYGHLSILQLALACGVSRSALVTQLRVLEQKGLIRLGTPQKVGRDIEIVFITQEE